ncbi:hypothetical protein RGQ30_29440 [Limnobacter thiooxidans]|uniref:Uncharacterized protein n=1 Tax=Limnobacter thiooxidans TaxID=131080 RepID=A0AA86J2S2_9BURK|nr:hypothetical protein RGQ30_29440 [Limnobacter thiooxidans]
MNVLKGTAGDTRQQGTRHTMRNLYLCILTEWYGLELKIAGHQTEEDTGLMIGAANTTQIQLFNPRGNHFREVCVS